MIAQSIAAGLYTMKVMLKYTVGIRIPRKHAPFPIETKQRCPLMPKSLYNASNAMLKRLSDAFALAARIQRTSKCQSLVAAEKCSQILGNRIIQAFAERIHKDILRLVLIAGPLTRLALVVFINIY